MGFVKAWNLYRKYTKAYKESKKLIKEKQGLKDELKELKSDIEAILVRLVNLLPPFRETAEGLIDILKSVF